jgi:CRP-like cAMP-binding protein
LNTNILLHDLKKYSDFKDEDFPEFLKLFLHFKIKKGDYFYQAGEIPKYSPFIVKGCMRKFFINENGEEQIVFFAEEGWFAGEVQCMRTNSKTEMYLQAMEDCDILGISLQNADYGLKNFPAYREYFDLKYAIDHSKIIQESTKLKTDTPESLYLKLLENRPSLILRVTQIHIANYLGVTTETISRIKKKIAQK